MSDGLTDRVVPSLAERLSRYEAHFALLEDQYNPHRPTSYLDRTVDSLAATVVSDTKTRADITHYTGEFLKTAALFSRGEGALLFSALAYGLDQARPDSPFLEQLADFGLGSMKGMTMRAGFGMVARSNGFAPTKGIFMGMTGRATDAVFDRQSIMDPSLGLSRLAGAVGNRNVWMFDAATFVAAEGMFATINRTTGGALVRNQTASGMVMGGSFGFVNGGSAELVRQQQFKEDLDIGRIMRLGLMDAGVGALGAGVGIKATDPRFQARLAKMFEPKPEPPPPLERPTLNMGPTVQQTPNGLRSLRLLGSMRAHGSIASSVPLGRQSIIINAMAPLMVGDQALPKGVTERQAWDDFHGQLAAAKRLGIEGISTDVWWGKIEPRPGEFNWNYYDMLSSSISKHGLKWVPILSFHQCGGNVGDNVYQPIPFWIWSMAQKRAGSSNPDAAKFVSEQGNASPEYVSYWATPLVIDRYSLVMREFQQRYAGKAHNISEINISLGPAGELRFPSYNGHDINSGYPTRGALQAYSDLARSALVDFAIKKYGSENAVREAWGAEFGQGIEPPRDVSRFFREGKHMSTQYGRDFFDFYSGTLGQHYNMVMGEAARIFSTPGAPFAGIDLGMKMPGIHWRVGENQGGHTVLGDRLSELSAGLIRTSSGDWHSNDLGRGYRPLLETVARLKPERGRIVPHFTALEMPDGHEGPEVKSMPHTLSRWVGMEGRRLGLHMKAENALGHTIYDRSSWDRMRSVLATPGNENGYYHGLTLLRMSNVLESVVSQQQIGEINQYRTYDSAQAR